MADTKERPQNQTDESAGKIKRAQRDEHTPGRNDVARGSEPSTGAASRNRT